MEFNIRGLKIVASFESVALLAFTLILFESSGNCSAWTILAVVLHEFGHIFAMCVFKSKPQKVCLGNLNVAIIDQKRYERSFEQDIFILFSGPFANIIASLVFYVFYLVLHEDWFFRAFLPNIFLGIFNLLPIICLDGGQILFYIICTKLDETKAKKITFVTSALTLTPLTILGIFMILGNKTNFSLILLSIYLLIAIFIKRVDIYS
ncbi:MAG: site-2 protease family protein [Oscillospiraceae bacterium]|nr:site-2 protease family protein [Oscillospiraceae bacterium]